MILGLTSSDLVVVDHIDGNKLNNQRSNLRVFTNSQNLCNRGKQANNTSGYKGVTFKKRDGKWVAQIKFHGKKIYIGTFASPEDAHIAYCAKAAELQGEFAHIQIKEIAQSIAEIPNGVKKTNSTGFSGIRKRGKYNKWEVKIQINGRRKYLGAFDSPEEAYAVYMKAKSISDGDITNDERIM